MPSWYSKVRAEQVPWWANFNQQCIDHSATFPSILTIPILANVAACAAWIATLSNEQQEAQDFAQEMTNYRNIWLDSQLGTGVPTPPVPPGAITPPANVVVGIEAFAVQLAGQLDAHPSMNDALRAAFGIAPIPGGTGSVSIRRGDALGGSQVALRLSLAGYTAVAVDRKRGGGGWEQIGTSITADFIDPDGPIVPGQSESREYRVQAIVANVRQGPISGSVLVATTP